MTARTGELVGPLGNHRDRQFFTGQVRAGQLDEVHIVPVIVDD